MNTPAKIVVLGIAAAALIAAGFQFAGPPRQAPSPKTGGILPKEGAFPDFKITSPAFVDSGDIPAKYTCDGVNISPRLEIAGVPANAKSLTLLMDYIDSASGNISVHWLVWNISPKTSVIPEGVVPAGAIEGTNDFKRAQYLGPCPQDSSRYKFVFNLSALDTTVDLPPTAATQAFIHAMASHVIASTQLNGYYGK